MLFASLRTPATFFGRLCEAIQKTDPELEQELDCHASLAKTEKKEQSETGGSPPYEVMSRSKRKRYDARAFMDERIKILEHGARHMDVTLK